MSQLGQLARFVEQASWDDISPEARSRLKLAVLDAVVCAAGALGQDLPRLVRGHVEELSGSGGTSLIGGGRAAPDRAAFLNGALVRYLDFNDSYLAPRETCHPSDNLGAVLAASEHGGGDGRGMLTALAVAYQVQCRLSDEAPVRERGFDHTVQGQSAAAAGAARAMGLDRFRIANAIAISVTAHNALRVTRTGSLSQWKGLAAPETGFTATHAALLARRGLTGPDQVYEGPKGLMEAVTGPFRIDWKDEDLERVRRTALKRHNAEIHAQSALEAVLELRRQHALGPGDVESVEIEIFDVAHRIIGGGEEGDKRRVANKEQADHSLPYMAGVALLDGQVLPEQYRPERIARDDVQGLLRRVRVIPRPDLSARFPEALPCRVRIRLAGGAGRVVEREQEDYPGYPTSPMDRNGVAAKLDRLRPDLDPSLREDLLATTAELDRLPLSDLTGLLERLPTCPAAGGGS